MESSVTLSFDVGELRLRTVVRDISDSMLTQPVEWLTESPMVLLVDLYQVHYVALDPDDDDSIRHMAQATYVVRRDGDDLKSWAVYITKRMIQKEIEKGVWL